jgi:hypothetical protein
VHTRFVVVSGVESIRYVNAPRIENQGKLQHTCSRSGREADHALADVPVAEQKLTAEVAFFDDVIIGHREQGLFPSTHPHAC